MLEDVINDIIKDIQDITPYTNFKAADDTIKKFFKNITEEELLNMPLPMQAIINYVISYINEKDSSVSCSHEERLFEALQELKDTQGIPKVGGRRYLV